MKKNILRSFFLFLLVSFLLLTALSCSDDQIIPPEEKPGRRDYTWTVDTLNYPYATLVRMWGSAPNDIWATSPGDWDKSISHYNGYQWDSYGVIGMNTPHSIFGFAYNNIYIAAYGGEIWRFNGGNWIKFAQLTKDGHTDIAFNDIWGVSSNDFYVFGGYPDTLGAYNNSVIAHYYNNKWSMMDTKEINGVVSKLYKNFQDNKIYTLTYKLGGGIHPDSSIIYEYEQGNFKKIYSSIWTGGLQADISLVNNEIYFILGNEIAKRANGQFQTFLKVNSNNFYQRIWGRNSKDIFLLMTDGLGHYNGNDLAYLFYFNKVPGTQIYGSALFEKEAFFGIYENSANLNLIYHGRLN